MQVILIFDERDASIYWDLNLSISKIILNGINS